jgi:hypothetical protein
MAQQVIRLILKGQILGVVETRNMFCYGHDGVAPVADDFSNCRSGLMQGLEYVRPWLSGHWGFYAIQKQHLVENEWVDDGDFVESNTGGGSGDLSSFQAACLFIGKTGVKRMVGKKFIPGVDESNTWAGGIGISWMVGCVAACAAWLTPVTAVGGGYWYLGVHGKGSVFAPFTSMAVSNLLSTMRRRKPGYGI